MNSAGPAQVRVADVAAEKGTRPPTEKTSVLHGGADCGGWSAWGHAGLNRSCRNQDMTTAAITSGAIVEIEDHARQPTEAQRVQPQGLLLHETCIVRTEGRDANTTT